jgi:nucleoside-diphosphate-sugar epimerase
MVSRPATILVTGNLGYVGPWVSRRLRTRYPNAELIGLDMGYFAHCLTGADHLPETVLDTQHFLDVRSCPERLLEGVDAVVHLAAVSNDPMGAAYEAITLDVNHRASVDLARLAKRCGVRSFVFASSCSVYGSADDRPRTERSQLAPLTAYAKSKVLTEQGLRELAGSHFRVSCLRFATACGMSPRLRLDLVLNDFVASALSTGRVTVLSDGSPWRPLIDVKDMARAIEWAVERDAHPGGDFLVVNVGREDWNYQVRELANAVAEAIPGTEVSINRDAPPDRRSYQVDFSLFRSLAPEHQPAADLTGTIEALCAGLESIRFRDANFRDSSFVRLRVLARLQARGLLSPTLEWMATNDEVQGEPTEGSVRH